MGGAQPGFSIETLRGGFLFLIRWLVQYPIVFGTYRIRNWSRSPFLLQPELRDKPGILVSNYGNYFYDDMLGGMLAPVWPFTFVRESVYRLPWMKWLFAAFSRALPIVRMNDARYSPDNRRAINEKTFSKVVGLLRQGHWFSVFPESVPGHRARVATPLRPGAAHVALRAEDASGWGLGLHIYPYGTNYENKFTGRSNVYIRWAPPIRVARFRDAYARSPAEAEKALLAEIEQALRTVVLEAPSLELLGDAHRLAHQRGHGNFQGVQEALSEVVSGRAAPAEMHRIVCSRANESVTYQVLGYVLLGIGLVIGWPFRAFGRLCAAEPSEDMTYRFMLWIMVLTMGGMVSEWHWAKAQVAGTWFSMTMWLWAWRRGIIS